MEKKKILQEGFEPFYMVEDFDKEAGTINVEVRGLLTFST